jgi:hypothetical protein
MILSNLTISCPANEQGNGLIIHVDDDGTRDYERIRDAIDAANDGAFIFVHEGVYNEHLTINGKSLHIIGAGVENTTIITTSHDAITIYACNGGSVQGFTIKSTKNAENGIFLRGSKNIAIKEKRFDSFRMGIALENSHLNRITKNDILTNISYSVVMYNGFANHISENNLYKGSFSKVIIYLLPVILVAFFGEPLARITSFPFKVLDKIIIYNSWNRNYWSNTIYVTDERAEIPGILRVAFYGMILPIELGYVDTWLNDYDRFPSKEPYKI